MYILYIERVTYIYPLTCLCVVLTVWHLSYECVYVSVSDTVTQFIQVLNSRVPYSHCVFVPLKLMHVVCCVILIMLCFMVINCSHILAEIKVHFHLNFSGGWWLFCLPLLLLWCGVVLRVKSAQTMMPNHILSGTSYPHPRMKLGT